MSSEADLSPTEALSKFRQETEDIDSGDEINSSLDGTVIFKVGVSRRVARSLFGPFLSFDFSREFVDFNGDTRTLESNRFGSRDLFRCFLEFDAEIGIKLLVNSSFSSPKIHIKNNLDSSLSLKHFFLERNILSFTDID